MYTIPFTMALHGHGIPTSKLSPHVFTMHKMKGHNVAQLFIHEDNKSLQASMCVQV